MRHAATPDRHPTPNAVDPYTEAADAEAAERRGMRRSLTVACAAHAALLAVTVPQLYTREVEASEKAKVFVVPTYRFKQPVEPTAPPPEPRHRRVPIPDPTPDELEPLYTPPPDQLDLPPVDEIALPIPDAPPEPDVEGPIPVGGKIAKPERIFYVEPRYTEPARKARIEGTVIVRTTIDTAGLVRDAEVLRGLPMGLTEEAVRAVEQWRFRPTTLNGKPVAVLYVVTVNFRLR